MAHNRSGADIVMNIRYAGASEIRSVTEHELNRSVDGTSAIDPFRSMLNEVLHGPPTQQAAIDQLWKSGVKKPTAQAEKPFVQMVLSASPEYFRDEGQGAGEWNESKLAEWKASTIEWLLKEYGADLLHVSLHLDEDTPHMHVLVVPTYTRKTRKPSQRKKSGEPDADFQKRLKEWEADQSGIRTAGRASNEYWSKKWCRRDARKSYHAHIEDLGIGYGRDFVGAGLSSPEHKTTAQFVREHEAQVNLREIDLEEKIAKTEDRIVAIKDGITAVSEEVKSRTIRRNEAGKIVVRDPARIKPALPEIGPVLSVAADFVMSMEQQHNAVAAEIEALRQERAEVSKLKKLLLAAVQRVYSWLKLKETPDLDRKEGVRMLNEVAPLLTPEDPRPDADDGDRPSL